MTTTSNSVAAELAARTIGARLGFQWIGLTKKADEQQQAAAADVFGASADSIAMAKRLINTKLPEYRAVAAVRSAAKRYWKENTLPYPEDGVRLLMSENLQSFEARMIEFRQELSAAVDGLEAVYTEFKREARRRLGRLYNELDYPETLADVFACKFDFPSLSANPMLLDIAPDIYEREAARVSARFTEAVELAETAFLSELAAMVQRITETLTGAEDGRPKIFRDSLIDNFTEFFNRFRRLSIGSSEQLTALVDQAQSAIRGIEPQSLRTSAELRGSVRASFASIQSQLDSAMVNKPARKLRFNRQPAAPSTETSEAETSDSDSAAEFAAA